MMTSEQASLLHSAGDDPRVVAEAAVDYDGDLGPTPAADRYVISLCILYFASIEAALPQLRQT